MLVAFAAMVISSCKNGADFTISGTVQNPGSLKKVFLLAADSAGVNVVDSASLNNGKFEFKRPAPYANFYRLRMGGAMFDLIAKKGDHITFEANLTDEKHDYTVTGSEESEKLREFNKMSNYYIGLTSKIYQEYEDKAQKLGKQSDSLLAVYRPVFMKNQDAYSVQVNKFMDANKNSLAGFFAATALDPIRYEQQLVAYAESIKDKFKDNPAVQRFVKGMMEVAPVSIGHKAPDFTIMGINDQPIKLADYKGKYVMLDFWASWCAPCRQENPNVVKQYDLYKSKGLNILGISLDVNKADWQKAINADHLSWAHGSDLKRFDGPTETLYHIQAIPSNFIIDPQGVIVAKNVTGADLEDFLNRTFNKPQ